MASIYDEFLRVANFFKTEFFKKFFSGQKKIKKNQKNRKKSKISVFFVFEIFEKVKKSTVERHIALRKVFPCGRFTLVRYKRSRIWWVA